MRFPVGLLLLTALGLIGQDQPILNEDIGIVNFEVLDYPKVAHLARIQGAVVVRVKVDPDGNVVSATVISGPRLLLPDCLANAKKWRFRPDKSREVVLVYVFKLEGICKLPCSNSSFVFFPPNVAIITAGEPAVDHN